MMNGRLSLQNVYKSFDHKGVTTHVLTNLSISFDQGVSYAIMGVSGTGKSTLMHILSGIDSPTRGAVYLNGTQLPIASHVARSSMIAKSIGVAFQDPYLIAELSALENVALAGLIAGDSPEIAYAHAQQLLGLVELTGKQSSSVLTLSGGQQQRVALARALYHKPAFLIADEPTGNLDEQTADVIIRLIASFCTEFGMGVIISTHDIQVARSMNHVYRLHNGVLESLSTI